MKIRSITTFLDPKWPLDEGILRRVGDFISAARPAFEAAGYEVQTARIATVPYPALIPSLLVDDLIHLAQELEKAALDLCFDYISLGPAFPSDLEAYELIPEVLAETQNVFLAGLMTTGSSGVSIPAVRACAQVIHQASDLTPDGFANLRFAALANVPPGAPFFPAAYHMGTQPAFALATEAADLAVEAFSGAQTLYQGRQRLATRVGKHARELCSIAGELEDSFKVGFLGLDFTLAPFPEEARSFGMAMERLGLAAVGLHGSLAAAAILTDTLDRVDYPRAGFNGLMLPVLEDTSLAARAAEGVLTIKDMLLYSAVCGTGLDTVPLPGDTTPEQITPVLLDLASLSLRLDKPLTARLMPIPGKEAGDETGFDFPYFTNSRVLALAVEPLHNFFISDEVIPISSRS